jgi:hypothetical protein
VRPKPLPTKAQFAALIDEAEVRLAAFRSEGPALLDLAKHGQRDGYVPVVGGGVSGGSRASGHGDPVGDAVAARSGADAFRSIAERMVEHLITSVLALRAADNAIDDSKPPPPPPPPKLDPMCRSCSRIGKHTPVVTDLGGRSGLCAWCYQWRAREAGGNGDMPALLLLEAHHSGKKMTTKLIDEARTDPRKRARVRKAKRKGARR